jgi:hypothetical protein
MTDRSGKIRQPPWLDGNPQGYQLLSEDTFINTAKTVNFLHQDGVMKLVIVVSWMKQGDVWHPLENQTRAMDFSPKELRDLNRIVELRCARDDDEEAVRCVQPAK